MDPRRKTRKSPHGFVKRPKVVWHKGAIACLDVNRMIKKWYEIRIEQEFKRALQEKGLAPSDVQP